MMRTIYRLFRRRPGNSLSAHPDAQNTGCQPKPFVTSGILYIELADPIGDLLIILLAILLGLACAVLIKSMRREKRATATQESLWSVINSLDVGVVPIDGKNNPVSYNPAAKKLASSFQMVDAIRLSARKLGESGELAETIQEIVDRRGTRYIKVSGKKLEGKGKGTFSGVIMLQDVSGSREAQQKLLEANKDLDSFCYSISHDLRAPLRTISGFSRILLEDYGKKLDNEAIRLCNVIVRGGERMSKLIDDLLEFSRVSKHDISPSLVNMRALFNMAAGKLLTDEQRSNIRLNILEMPDGWGDPDLIMQVVMNLLSNAVKYSSRQSSPVIVAGAEIRDDETVYYVRDNGVGFDMQYYDKLFEVFQRLHGRAEFEGTGVGLSIVDRIVRRHGGKVWAESSPGHGATFYFTLKRQSKTKTVRG